MKLPINIRPGFYYYLAMMIFLLPLKWLIATFTAGILHELGHLAVARITGLHVHSVCLDLGGARINTAPATNGQTLFTAIAGPAVGFLLCLSYPVFPKLAFCAFLQSLFNLMPVLPFDGGRVLLSICNIIIGNNRGKYIYRYISLIIVFISGLSLYAVFHKLWITVLLFISAIFWIHQEKKILLANRL